jgi:hypothetical protein
LRETDRFLARSDDGREFAIVEFTTFLDAGNGTWIPGIRELRTSDDTAVNFNSDGVFEVLLGPIVHRV